MPQSQPVNSPPTDEAKPSLANCPILLNDGIKALLIDEDGSIENLDAFAALTRLKTKPHLVVHSVFTIDRLARFSSRNGNGLFTAAINVAHFDVLELFAFIHPTVFVRPSIGGLLDAMGIENPESLEEQAIKLHEVVGIMLNSCSPQQINKAGIRDPRQARQLAQAMHLAGWVWGAPILEQMGAEIFDRPDVAHDSTGVNIWARLPNWEEFAPRPPAGSLEVTAKEAQDLLAKFTGKGAEIREGQQKYAAEASKAFNARASDQHPHIVLGEAGTGIGKTFGYLAPALAWARKNDGRVQISTYTKALQRQIDQQLINLYPNIQSKQASTVIRKGRENYMCLLNFEEWAGKAIHQKGAQAVVAGLLARWGMTTLDGDMVGGDLPSWLLPLLTHRAQDGANRLSVNLTDTRGECIHGACPHYGKCYIEKSKRRANRAELVISNHALVMHNLAYDGFMKQHNSAKPELVQMVDGEEVEPQRPRIVFDEGHHLFDAADSCFAAHLTGLEMAELRRWLRGAETGTSGGRTRGLKSRLEELIYDDDSGMEALSDVLHNAMKLPAPRWNARLSENLTEGPAEAFLGVLRGQVYARAKANHSYDLEVDCYPLIDGVLEAADNLRDALTAIVMPLKALCNRLSRKLVDEAENLEPAQKAKLEAAITGIERRSIMQIPMWIEMLKQLEVSAKVIEVVGQYHPDFVDWFHIHRRFGKDFDVGMYRHYIDPSKPLAKYILSETDGALITSATLRDHVDDLTAIDNGIVKIGADDHDLLDWRSAESRTGASHLPMPAYRFSCDSPFDYAKNTDIIIIQDINRDNPEQVAAAMQALFIAAGGGGLGLFTAISRLRQTYDKLILPMSEQNIQLYAQHVDPLDIGTLIDMFRANKNSCLLGTDAVRDGVDVPGASLRLLVYDRVPWLRPSILERARKAEFGGNQYADMMTRFKLKQAFGRLIRRADDKGVFVMLDKRMPTRLQTAFPKDVTVHKIGLKEAVRLIAIKLDQNK
uniref:Helicase n=1 Tax=OCS116 cluster bacterium TaxID=2030921 RepID=A0A2A4Z2L4_9PROT